MRPRLFLLVLALLGAYAAAAPSLEDDQSQAEAEFLDELLASLDTREKVQQLFIVGFRGPEVSEELNQFIVENRVGGVFLNRENCNIVNGSDLDPRHCGFAEGADPDTPAQMAALTQALQKASCTATTGSIEDEPYCLPLFISIDHEGDDRPMTRLLNRFTPIPSNMAIGATFDASNAEAIGCIVGQELAAVGVNMLLGPDLDVLDLPRSGGPGDLGIRVFGGDPLWVSEMSEAYVRGAHRCGDGRLATVVKHFPGHGRSTRDVDEEARNLVTKTLAELQQVDLAPFTAVSEGDPGDLGVTDAIMNSHLTYTAVDGCDGSTPVTFSASCMETFITASSLSSWRRGGGVTVADALSVGSVDYYAETKWKDYPQGTIALEALLAGNDVLPLVTKWEWQALSPTVDYLVNRYEADQSIRDRIDDAARRILGLKYRLYDGLEPTKITGALDYSGVVGSAESADTVSSIAEAALTFIRPAGRDAFLATVRPPTLGQRILFVECWDDPTCAPPLPENVGAYPSLWPRGKLANLTLEMFPDRVSSDNLDSIGFGDLRAVMDRTGSAEASAAVESADWLVFAFLELDPAAYPSSQVLKDFLRSPGLLRDKTVAVFAYNSPYHLDAGEMSNVDLFVALYSKIEPSLGASLKALFQDPTISGGAAGLGSLPVDYIYDDFVVSDVSEQVQADPSQTIDLVFDPPEPVQGTELTVSLARPLLARNGHTVADGMAVEFGFELPDGGSEQVATTTVDGLATASIDPLPEGDINVVVRSGELEWGQSLTVVPIDTGAPSEPTSAPETPDESAGGGGVPVLLVVSLAAGIPLAGLALASAVYLRRRAPSAAKAAIPSATPIKPALRVDAATHRVFVGGEEVEPPLSREQYEFLACLYENAGMLCTREDLILRVWPDAEATGVSEEALDSLVHRLRDRLRAAGADKALIVTVRGRGFRLEV